APVDKFLTVKRDRWGHGRHVAMDRRAFRGASVSGIVAYGHVDCTVFFFIDELDAVDFIDLLINANPEFGDDVPEVAVPVPVRSLPELQNMFYRFAIV